MLYRPGPYRESITKRGDGDPRDLKATCDHLLKELERRDIRNENLTKELQTFRASVSTQQVIKFKFNSSIFTRVFV
jgi:hypothetical protein